MEGRGAEGPEDWPKGGADPGVPSVEFQFDGFARLLLTLLPPERFLLATALFLSGYANVVQFTVGVPIFGHFLRKLRISQKRKLVS